MSSSVKVSLLALVSTVAAVPQYGYGYAHSKFHGSGHHGHHGTGTGKPYPTGGYQGYNATGAPYPTGYTGDSTTNVYVTSYQTVVETVTLKGSAPAPAQTSPVANYEAAVQAASSVNNNYCGPATVTVTASEQYTVTVTPDSYQASSYAPASSAAPVEAQSSQGYSAAPVYSYVMASSVASVQASSSAAAEYSVKPAAYQPSSSEVASYAATPASSQQPAYSAATPSASSSAVPVSSGNTYSGIKRGLAYTDAAQCKSLGGKYGYGYNWGQVENNDIGTNFIPMMHKPSDSTAEAWLANVDKAVKKGSTAVMGFNECDDSEQCNLTPEAACSAWIQYMNPIKAKYPQVTIIGPSITNGLTAADGSPMGVNWLSRFETACPNAIVDAHNVHFYDIYQDKTTNPSSTTIDRFQAQVEKVASTYGKKVWVTEYGLNTGSATDAQAASFLKDTIAYLDNADHVQGYSWFKVGTDQYGLNSANGASAIGEVYASA